jgi:hypothetical protein
MNQKSKVIYLDKNREQLKSFECQNTYNKLKGNQNRLTTSTYIENIRCVMLF